MQVFVNELIIGIIVKNPIVWIIMILAVISSIFYKQILGKLGEYWTKSELKKLSKEYLVINDLMIRTKDNITHQIDHLVISKYGIFVIETKQYNGYITGGEYDKKWCVKAGKNKLYISNPFYQNYGHLKALEEVLELNKDKFVSLVCIPSTAKVKVNSNNLVRAYNIVEKIESYKAVILNEYDTIYNKLLSINITDRTIRKAHNKYACTVKKGNDIKDVNKCPMCGGDLIERNGKYGKFIGCSNFPKCRYKRK